MDLVFSQALRPALAELAEHLAQAADLGLHLVLARRVGGIGRASMGDVLLAKLGDLGTSGLILSGDRREGALIGDQRATLRNPGRGALVSRQRGTRVIQVVHEPPIQ